MHELHLESNEELLVIKAKRRKFVIFCEAPDYGSGGASRLCESCCIGLPLWTFHPTDSEDFKLRIKALEYPWWIYLPEAKALGMQEGCSFGPVSGHTAPPNGAYASKFERGCNVSRHRMV